MKKVIITGATSFLGRNTVKRLLSQNFELYLVVRNVYPTFSSFIGNDKIHIIQTTLDNLGVIRNHVDRADIFIHFAWAGSGNEGRASDNIQAENVMNSCQALNIANELKCKMFIFPGSQAEYGNIDFEITEDVECTPVSPYGKAKYRFGLFADEFCKDKEISFVHLRIFSVYGPDDRKGTLVDECINVFSEDGSLRLGACEQKWNYLYISDFTDLIFEMIQKGCKSGIYNVGGEETEILKKFVLTIKQLCGNKGEVSFDGKASNPEGSPNLMPNIGRIKAEVGWQPRVTFELGIEEILRRKKENEVICS